MSTQETGSTATSIDDFKNGEAVPQSVIDDWNSLRYSSDSDRNPANSESVEDNNPLRLLRPVALHSVRDLEGRFQEFLFGRNYDPKSFEAPSPATLAKAIEVFESLACNVLERLNEPEKSKRFANLPDELLVAYHRLPEYVSTSIEELLMCLVLSILIHPSEEISTVARSRALELLSLRPTELLKLGVEPSVFFGSFLDHSLPRRVPHTFCSEREFKARGHNLDWFTNPKIQEIIVMQGEGRIDWGQTQQNLLNNPREAVQIILLLMHSPSGLRSASVSDKTGTVDFLKGISFLPAEQQIELLGPDATFIRDNAIARGIRGDWENDVFGENTFGDSSEFVDEFRSMVDDLFGDIDFGNIDFGDIEPDGSQTPLAETPSVSEFLVRTEGAIGAREAEITRRDEEISRLRWAIFDQTARIAQLQDLDAEDEKQVLIESLRKELAESEARIQELEEELAAFDDQDGGGSEQLKKVLEFNRGEVARLRSEVTGLRENLEEAVDSKARLEAKNRDLERELEALRSTNAAQAQTVRMLQELRSNPNVSWQLGSACDDFGISLKLLLAIPITKWAKVLKDHFRKYSPLLHPDRNPHNPNATDGFQRFQTAYEVLKEEAKRRLAAA